MPQSFVSAIIRMMEKPTQKRFSEWDSIIAALNTNLAKPVDELSSVVGRALRKEIVQIYRNKQRKQNRRTAIYFVKMINILTYGVL